MLLSLVDCFYAPCSCVLDKNWTLSFEFVGIVCFIYWSSKTINNFTFGQNKCCFWAPVVVYLRLNLIATSLLKRPWHSSGKKTSSYFLVTFNKLLSTVQHPGQTYLLAAPNAWRYVEGNVSKMCKQDTRQPSIQFAGYSSMHPVAGCLVIKQRCRSLYALPSNVCNEK